MYVHANVCEHTDSRFVDVCSFGFICYRVAISFINLEKVLWVLSLTGFEPWAEGIGILNTEHVPAQTLEGLGFEEAHKEKPISP